jgi:hypothetical protein
VDSEAVGDDLHAVEGAVSSRATDGALQSLLERDKANAMTIPKWLIKGHMGRLVEEWRIMRIIQSTFRSTTNKGKVGEFGKGLSVHRPARPRFKGGTPEANQLVYQVEPKFLHAHRRHSQAPG